MASVNLQCRTFTLRGLRVRWHGRINTVCNTELSPLLPAVQASRRQLSASLPRCPHFPNVTFDLLSVKQPKGRETWSRRDNIFVKLPAKLKVGPFISGGGLVLGPFSGTYQHSIHFAGMGFSNHDGGGRSHSVSMLPVRTPFEALFSMWCTHTEVLLATATSLDNPRRDLKFFFTVWGFDLIHPVTEAEFISDK